MSAEDGKIEWLDFANPEILKKLQELYAELDKFSKPLADIANAMKNADEQLKKGVTTHDELAKKVKQVSDEENKLSDVEKQINKIDEQTYQVLTKMVAARSDENKKLQEATERMKRENLERKAAIDSNEGLRARIALLRADKEKLIHTDKDYKKNLDEINTKINKYQKELDKTKDSEQNRIGSIGKYKESWNGITGVISKAVGAFAAVGITMATFHKFIGSSESLTDRYEAAMKGAETATNAFFASVRDGDWSNLLDNMKLAYERGEHYQQILDSIKKTERANALILKEKREEYLKLREQAMDQNLTAKQNYEAATKALNLIKENYDNQKTLVEKEINNQAYLLNLKTGENLSDEEKIENTKIIMRAYVDRDKVDKNVRDRAEEINEKLRYQQELLKLNQLIPFRTESIDKEAKSYQNEIDKLTGLTDEYHIYAAILRVVEQKKSPKAIQDYIDLLNKQAEAKSAFDEENKRMEQTQNNAKSKISDEEKKRIEDNIKEQEKESKTNLSNLEKTWKAYEKDIEKGETWLKNWRTIHNKKRDEDSKDIEDTQKMFNKSWDDRLETTKESLNYEHEMGRISTNEYEQEIYDRTKIALQAKIDYAKKANLDASEYEKQLAKLTADYKIEQLKKEKEAIKETYQLQVDSANQASSIFISLGDREVQNLESQKDKELKTHAKNEKEKEAIEERYEKKINTIKKRQAIIDRATAIFNIWVHHREAMLKNEAMAGTVAGKALNMWQRIDTALQIAAVLAQPMPKYFKGVKNLAKNTLAWVGEKGFELGETKEGKMFLTPDKASVMALPQGVTIHTHEKSLEKIREMNPFAVKELINEQRLTRQSLSSIRNNSMYVTKDGWFNTQTSIDGQIKWRKKYMGF